MKSFGKLKKNQMMKEMYTGLQKTLKNFGRC